MVNTNELKKRMIDLGVNVDDLAKYVGRSSSNVYSKLRGKIPLSLYEAEQWQTFLQIDDCDFGFYFMSHSRISQ